MDCGFRLDNPDELRHHAHLHDYAIDRVERAILLLKTRSGHDQPLLLTATERLLASELINMFVAIDWVAELPPFPPIVVSLEIPPALESPPTDRVQSWDVERLLGEYRPGRDCRVTIYERSLAACVGALALPKLAHR